MKCANHSPSHRREDVAFPAKTKRFCLAESDKSAVKSMTFYGGHEGSSVYVPGRDDSVDEIMREWEHKFCTYSEASIFITTFNVNGKMAPYSLTKWLHYDGRPPDFYVVGLQEMDLSTQAFFYDVSSRHDEWVRTISRSLPLSKRYTLVETVRLVGIMLVVFRRTDSQVHVPQSSVHSARLPTGIQLISRMGNKGGVAISMQVNDSRVCFVNSHMAAGNEELDKRNQDYREISQMRFEAINKSLFDHDVIFWLGDLNYRLETQNGFTNDDVRRLCSSPKTFRDMIAFDTLKQQQRSNQVFVGFNEPDVLNFRPSYKYDPGTSQWDSSEKSRCPAWCDRILWWCEAGDQVVQTLYDSVDEVTLSDHKPVRAVFELTVRKVDKKKVKRIHEEAIREADKRANEALPQIWLSDSEVDFGDVYFFESSVRTITVKNTGKSKVSFSFIALPNRPTISDSWLSVTPPSAHLKVGASCLLSLQVLVDKKTAWSVGTNGGLSDILVLRLDHGRDYFLPITARYHHSVFGSSFVKLIQKEHSTNESPSHLIDLNVGESPTQALSAFVPVPVAMYRLVESLRQHGVDKIRFDDVSSHLEFIALRNALDYHPSLNLFEVCKSPFNMFNALLRLMDSFRVRTQYILEEMIPRNMQTECLNTVGDAVRCWACVQKFPRENRDVFEYYVHFTRELLEKNADARTQLQVMADIAFKTGQLEDKKQERALRLQFLETVVAFPKEVCVDDDYAELITF
uniref:Inositol polyphosphate-related phosphatase domain-containing protein n=1 Tax=Ascaris lumbricoides TaxID=6252 RepID=A0A9J2P5P1_ASCLU